MNTKNKKLFGVIAAGVILAIGLMSFSQVGNVSAAALDRWGSQGGYGAQTGPQTTTPGGRSLGIPSGNGTAWSPLTAAQEQALIDAILEEYGAYNLYSAIGEQFGDVFTFSQIAKSELQHVSALIRQAEKYGVEVPENPGLQIVPEFDTLSEACAIGVAAEIADAEFYDEISPLFTQTEVLRVFDRLKTASLESHLPAFEACQQ